MNTEVFSVSIRAQDLDSNLKAIQKAFKNERGGDYPLDVIKDCIIQFFESTFEKLNEDMLEKFTIPGPDFYQLEGFLESRMQLEATKPELVAVEQVAVRQSEVQQGLFDAEENIYNGYQLFSFDKGGSMIEYITFLAKGVFETNLNKLLFYSDFSFYYLTDKGMSGTPYIKHQYGPVPEGYENVLQGLSTNKTIRHKNIVIRGEDMHVIRNKETYNPAKSGLTANERKLIDWVWETYGKYAPRQISDLSHEEKAYKYTDWQEQIAYEYAKHLNHLPPKNLLD